MQQAAAAATRLRPSAGLEQLMAENSSEKEYPSAYEIRNNKKFFKKSHGLRPAPDAWRLALHELWIGWLPVQLGAACHVTSDAAVGATLLSMQI